MPEASGISGGHCPLSHEMAAYVRRHLLASAGRITGAAREGAMHAAIKHDELAPDPFAPDPDPVRGDGTGGSVAGARAGRTARQAGGAYVRIAAADRVEVQLRRDLGHVRIRQFAL